MQRLLNPLPIWLDQRGALIDAGSIYVGIVHDDPEDSPVDVFWDSALSIPAEQPLRTRGGVIVNNGTPSAVWVAVDDYSIRVRDADGSLVSYTAHATDLTGDSSGGAGPSFQPLDLDLTALSGLGSTAYGRGTVSGNILRQGAGPHVYFTDPAMTSGRIFVTAEGAADPTTDPGDLWLTI
jgi:hypothetical protein